MNKRNALIGDPQDVAGVSRDVVVLLDGTRGRGERQIALKRTVIVIRISLDKREALDDQSVSKNLIRSFSRMDGIKEDILSGI